MKLAVTVIDGDRPAERGIDLARGAFTAQHGDDLFCRAVAEELAEGLFVPGDAVALDQREKVGRRVAGQGRLGEMRVGGEEVGCGRADIGEIAAPAAGDEDLSAGTGAVVDQQDFAAALPGERGAIHPRRAGADDDCVIVPDCGHGGGPSGGST